MADVRVAISLDSAVRGPIVTNETGPRNGWLVQALARAYTGGDWTSLSGGGGYDYSRFREAGIQGLALEDNYPSRKNTPPTTCRRSSERPVCSRWASRPWRLRASWAASTSTIRGCSGDVLLCPAPGFIHYPQAWALRCDRRWRAFAPCVGARLVAQACHLARTGHCARGDSRDDRSRWVRRQPALGARAEAHGLGDLPLAGLAQVIPPFGGLVAAVFAILVLGLAVLGYWLARRWTARADWS